MPPNRGGGAPSGYPTRGMAAAPDARYGGGGGGHGGFGVGDYGGGGDPYDDRFRGGDRREYGKCPSTSWRGSEFRQWDSCGTGPFSSEYPMGILG